jgi:hypothetical protein
VGAGGLASRTEHDADRYRWLSAVAAAQLTLGALGLTVALKRRHPYDFLMLHGRSDKVWRDSMWMGTALSAPAVMLVAQGDALLHMMRGETQPADRVLGGLGAAMVGGYLGEALVRRRLHRPGFDRLESPLVVFAVGLAAAMAALGLAPRRLIPEPR